MIADCTAYNVYQRPTLFHEHIRPPLFPVSLLHFSLCVSLRCRHFIWTWIVHRKVSARRTVYEIQIFVCAITLFRMSFKLEYTSGSYDVVSELSGNDRKFIIFSVKYTWNTMHCRSLHGRTPWPLVICSRNRVPGPGSKIHYPVPNPGNWYPVFALITDEKCNFDLPLHLFITYVMTFDLSLYLLRSLLFCLRFVFTFW